MRDFSASPAEMLASLWRNRELVMALTKRDVLGRYRGSVLGLLWSLFNPLFMLAIFTFVFSVIFQARWGSGGGSRAEFALLLFAGLLVFNLFAECISRASGLVISNTNYVKKVAFPLEILPFISLLSALFHIFVSLGVWLLIYALFFGVPSFTVIYFPVVLLPFCLFLLGVSWTLASLGVFLRDVSQLIGLFIPAVLFMTPIFYPATAFPERYHFILFLNPLTTVVEQTREVMFWGRPPDFLVLGIYWVVMCCACWLGFAWFQKTRKGFADVL